MTTQEARERFDKALCDFMETLGYDPADVDYSSFNELLDDIEALAK